MNTLATYLCISQNIVTVNRWMSMTAQGHLFQLCGADVGCGVKIRRIPTERTKVLPPLSMKGSCCYSFIIPRKGLLGYLGPPSLNIFLRDHLSAKTCFETYDSSLDLTEDHSPRSDVVIQSREMI